MKSKFKAEDSTVIYLQYSIYYKDVNVHRFALSTLRGELMDRERERKRDIDSNK